MMWPKHRHFYRREGDEWLVEIRIERLEQLFNSLDPLPFWQRDLDPAAAAYILESVQELPHNAAIRLLVYLPEEEVARGRALIASALCGFFLYRAKVNRQRLRDELRRGRISLLVGLSFLTLCFLLSGLFHGWETVGSNILREGLLIMGWVAMWRPVQILLYDWWPHLGRARLYERVAHLPVDVRAREPAAVSGGGVEALES